MAAQVVKKLPEGDAWIYELKFDGYRALIIKDEQRVELRARKNKNLTKIYPGVAAAGIRLNADQAVVDGEIVALDVQRATLVQALQHRGSRAMPARKRAPRVDPGGDGAAAGATPDSLTAPARRARRCIDPIYSSKQLHCSDTAVFFPSVGDRAFQHFPTTGLGKSYVTRISYRRFASHSTCRCSTRRSCSSAASTTRRKAGSDASRSATRGPRSLPPSSTLSTTSTAACAMAFIARRPASGVATAGVPK